MTREQMIDEAIRRICRFWRYDQKKVLAELLADGVHPSFDGFKSYPFWAIDIRAEFRRIQGREVNRWNADFLARAEDMKQRYAHTYEVKH